MSPPPSSTCATTRTGRSAPTCSASSARSAPISSRSRPTTASSPGDRIGATGLESQYDYLLRGRNGAIKVPVDAFGNPRGRQLSRVEPEVGDNLKLTLDEKIQKVGESALAAYGLPGAFVVMNVNDGSILGMGSYPTFDPSVYTPPVSTKTADALANDEADPLLDRAIQAGYPTGSTFKLVSGSAALESRVDHPRRTPSTTPARSSSVTTRGRTPARRRTASSTWSARSGSPPTSSSTTSAGMANNVYDQSGKEIIQDWAKQLGFGGLTGIDLPGEGAGLVPTPEWRDKLFEDAGKPDSCGGKAAAVRADGCYETDRALERRRQHEPRGRPGRPAGDAAAARDRVRGDRQRGRGRPAAPRARGRGRRPGRRRRSSTPRRVARSSSRRRREAR